MLPDLAWLLPPPEAVRSELKALQADAVSPSSDFINRLVRLSLTRLDEAQLRKIIKIARSIPSDVGPFASVKLGLIGDGTLSLLGEAIAGSGVRHGLIIDVVEGGYGVVVQDAVDTNGPLHAAKLDMALLVLDHRLAGLDRAAADADAAKARVDAAFGRIRTIVEAMRTGLTGPMLVQTLVTPLEPLFGSFDRAEPGSVFSMIDALNARIAAWAREGGIVVVDTARLAAAIGHERWDDPGHWHASKLGFAPEFIPVYADVVARTLAAIKGKAKKVLVLDLDNTVWGGVIGDEGIEGIRIGQGSASGEAFLAIQQMALELRARGIVLAVCSKNDEAVARIPFRDHPDMLIREDHIAVFQANWSDKAHNLRAIAETLNVGVDSLVLLDDNPAERAQVRRELPMVGVPELPDNPALYPRMLAAAGYFDTVAVSAEDRTRAAMYQSNAKRARLMAATSDMGAYLASLEMVCTIGSFDPVSRSRVAQLINKSNQFNLTTRRYTESDVAGIEAEPGRHAVHLRLADSFGDNGIISVLIADKRGEVWEIDSWLMSCRVLGRRVQELALAHLAAAARAHGATRITGHYIPSGKNRIVEDHYAKLGFNAAGDAPDGGTCWTLDLASYVAPELPFTVIDDVIVKREHSA